MESIRFGYVNSEGVRETIVLSLEELMSGSYAYLSDPEVKKMVSLETKTLDGTMLYDGDILRFDISDLSENDGFFNSGMGEKASEVGIDSFIVIFKSNEARGLSSSAMYALKDGTPMYAHEVLGFDIESDDELDIWREVMNDVLAFRYLVSKGAYVWGNVWEDEEYANQFPYVYGTWN